jgi:hypothetical protein
MAGADGDQRRSRLSRWLATLVALPALVSAVRAAFSDWRPTGIDNPLILLRTWEVGGPHTPLVGAWSRYGWEHPGPIMFFTSAPLVRLLGAPGLTVTIGLVNAAAAAGAVLAAQRVGGLKLAAVTAAGLAVMLHALGTYDLLDPWNPYVVTVPLLAYLLCVVGAMQGDNVLLVGAVVAGAWCTQAHVATVPIVLTATLIGTGWCLAERMRGNVHLSLRWIAVAAGVGVVLWLPPMIEQVIHEGGNLGQLYRFNNTSARAGYGEAVDVGAHSFGYPAPWMGAPETGGYLDAFKAKPGAAVFLFVVFAAMALAAWRFLGRRIGAVAGFGVLLVPASICAMSRSTDQDLFAWTIRWTWAVAAFAWIGAAYVVVVAIRRRAPGDVPRTAGLLAFGILLVGLVGSTLTDGDATKQLDLPSGEGIATISSDLRDHLDPDTTYVLSIDAPGALFPYLPAIAVDMLVHDSEVLLGEEIWEVSFEDRFVADPAKTYARVVITPRLDERWGEMERAKGGRHVGHYDPLTRTERAEADRLLQQVLDEADMTDAEPIETLEGATIQRLVDAGADPDKVHRLKQLEDEGPAMDAWLVRPSP